MHDARPLRRNVAAEVADKLSDSAAYSGDLFRVEEFGRKLYEFDLGIGVQGVWRFWCLVQSLVLQRFSSRFCSSTTASRIRVSRKSLFLGILRPTKSLSVSRLALQELILDGMRWAFWRLPRPKQTQGSSLQRSAQPKP